MKDNLGWGMAIALVVVVLALSLGLTYLIATSDLPDWLKYFLLK